jgi:hypothetical protein
MAFTGTVLSGSTNGRPIPVAATSTPGTLIHTAGASGFDEVWINVSNVTAGAQTLTVEWGGVSDPGDHLVKAYSVAANSAPIPVSLGLRLAGGLSVRAFSSSGSTLNITGYVNQAR